MDKKTSDLFHQNRRNRRQDDRGDKDNVDDRLADGFDLMDDEDPKDALPNLLSEQDEE